MLRSGAGGKSTAAADLPDERADRRLSLMNGGDRRECCKLVMIWPPRADEGRPGLRVTLG
jgi:hypothetical protein